MHPILFLAAVAAVAAEPPPPSDEAIVVTGAREPVARDEAPVSATVFEGDALASLALPATADLLRLSPGLSVATSGPRGTLTQVRIRGAEANHTLLFVDGIRFNDPAAGNEARFELLSNDILSRVEVVRGPQSALWGSEALGGVIAVDSADPSRARGVSALGEYGSLDSGRASAQFAAKTGPLGLSGAAGWLSTRGVDSLGGGAGDRDGFDTLSASLKAVLSPLPSLRLGLVGHWMQGTSEFDGSDPLTFRRADTRDETRNRIGAVRGWASSELGAWALSADASFLASRNVNRNAAVPLNRTTGNRLTTSAQVARSVGGHRFTAAWQHERERFRRRDEDNFGGTNQDRSRTLDAFVGEWHAKWSSALSTDVAVRRDRFSAFKDATTVRAAAILTPAPGWRLHGAYGEGIAQPTFFDLYGFFPGFFRGNPNLKPERSKGWEAGLSWNDSNARLAITGFSNRLQDEIVETFDLATFLSGTANVSGKSRRRGVEVEGEYRPSSRLLLAFNYTYLDASEQRVAAGAQVREVRRPRHSANLIASATAGAFSGSASLAYVGRRQDRDFDVGRTVTLNDYVLASARLGYRISRSLEAYARAENALGARYQDVVGYNTPGRTVYAGLRLRLGD